MASESFQRTKSGETLVDYAKRQLKYTWKRKPECNIHNISSHCHCRLEFFDIHALKEWMYTTEDENTKTNAERLVMVIDLKAPPGFFFKVKSVFEGDDESVLVFGYLLMHGCEDLLYLFCTVGITDKTMADISDETYRKLRRLCPTFANYSTAEIDSIAKQFEEEKWAFCPAQIGDPRDQDLQTKIRLPFLELTEIKEGGTARVIKVSVQKSFVSQQIQDLVKPAKSAHPIYGEVSTVCLFELLPNTKLKYYSTTS